MKSRVLSLLFLVGLVPWLAWADIVCDGDDWLIPFAPTLSNFLSVTTGSMVLVYTPTGAAGSLVSSANCYNGERVFVDYLPGQGAVGFFRNGDLSGTDQLCAMNYTTGETHVPAVYTVGVRTHLAWVHSGGTLFFYKDGALVGSTPSGDTASVATDLLLCFGSADGQLGAQGVIAEAKIYPVALSAAQIAAEATSGLHNMIAAAPTGLWALDTCAVGTAGNGVSFRDTSGSGHPMTADDGDNNTGMTCQGSTLAYPWGVW